LRTQMEIAAPFSVEPSHPAVGPSVMSLKRITAGDELESQVPATVSHVPVEHGPQVIVLPQPSSQFPQDLPKSSIQVCGVQSSSVVLSVQDINNKLKPTLNKYLFIFVASLIIMVLSQT
jgi:hypothetical protein